jgi:hypothetical protein
MLKVRDTTMLRYLGLGDDEISSHMGVHNCSKGVRVNGEHRDDDKWTKHEHLVFQKNRNWKFWPEVEFSVQEQKVRE